MYHHSQRPTWELDSHMHDSGLCRFRGLASKGGMYPPGDNLLVALVPLHCLCQETSRRGEGPAV